MGRYARTICFLLFILFLQLVSSQSQLSPTQNSIMTRLYGLFHSSTVSFIPWNMYSDPNPCSWKGVLCSSNNNSSIIQLSLSWFSLSSSDFLPVVCQIDTLESLDVSNNHLSSIPDEFINDCGKISNLRVLNFSRNKLAGSLPTFNGFGMLEFLDLSHNSFSGNIDLQLDGLVALKSLNLSYNIFNGYVPTHLGKSNLLEELELSTNLFRGNIPQEIANHGNLTLIDLGVNMLSGPIPGRFAELSKLKVFVLSSNSLIGDIPQFLVNITTLIRFAAHQNKFTGGVPRGITRYLWNLDLSYNSLTGSIPSDLLSQPNLQSVDLSYNSLEGSIPENMSPNLIRLRLGGNSFTGPIPSASFGSLQKLIYLEMENNLLTGPIPIELCMCKNLALLNLAQNSLTGPVPPEFGSLSNLQVLSLQANKLVGQFPARITNLTRLQKLNISWNLLNGSIPSSLSSLQNLANLDLQGNHLRGSIPDSISSLSSLIELQLGDNKLSGIIPLLPTNLQIALNLSNNLYKGPIPETLSSLRNLEVLDLSNNRFSGVIPDFLTNLPSLTQLELANNQLSGAVPTFKSFVTVDVNGNKGLYNSTSTSPSVQKKKKSIAAEVVVAVSAGFLAVLVVALVALLISRRWYRISDEHAQLEEEISQPKIIEGKLLTASGLHGSNIDFSKAMEAVADCSNISLKTRFSTYYKAAMPSGVAYFVKKLNRSDKIFQLGNHDKFGGELVALGKLSNSNIMIPLAYVLTANSAYLFYDYIERGTLFDVFNGSSVEYFDWSCRYSIAIGVAQGLAYLHECSSGPVLLLDLSSKSILLKSLREPLIGDIELYKVIDPSKSTGSLSTVAGSIGYIAPEYAYTMRMTMAGNVYSFGVILLELVTGLPAVGHGMELTKWVSSNLARQGKWDHILDFTISRSSLAVKSQMLEVLKIALACVRASPQARPKAKSVLRMLLNAR